MATTFNRPAVYLLVARVGAIVAACVVRLCDPLGWRFDDVLKAALWSLIVVMVALLGVDLVWARLLRLGGMGRSTNEAIAWGPFVGLVVTTAGVVLGVLQASTNTGSLPTSLKVGTLSLAAAVMLGLMLFGVVVSAAPKGSGAQVFRAFLFNLTLWALALGLLTIAWSMALR